jgi:hypothetical protein
MSRRVDQSGPLLTMRLQSLHLGGKTGENGSASTEQSDLSCCRAGGNLADPPAVAALELAGAPTSPDYKLSLIALRLTVNRSNLARKRP